MSQKLQVYLLTRLYNIDDKIRTCLLERNLKEYFSCSIYMPYRDSREEKINQKNWKEEIFKIDIREIDKSDLLIGFLDGPEFDEGVGFEIGYAITKGKKVIIVNSDFISYSYNESIISKLPDNLLKILDIKWINYSPYIDFDRFCDSLKENRENMLKEIILAINEKYSSKEKFIFDKMLHGIEKEAGKTFVEIGNSHIYYRFFSSMNNYVVSKRQRNFSVDSCMEDLRNLLTSERILVVSNGPEVFFGSAIICGISYALGIPFYIIDDRLIHLSGMYGNLMKTNLMIDCACSGYYRVEDLLNETI